MTQRNAEIAQKPQSFETRMDATRRQKAKDKRQKTLICANALWIRIGMGV